MRISKREKELLEQAFSVPAPKKKRAFLHTLPKQEAGLGALVLSQAAYIRKWVWAASLLVFGLVVFLAQYMELDIIWMLSAIMPFAALLIVMEFAKSSAYGMSELEMTSRFSLRTILMARMVMIGAVQLMGVLLTIPVAGPVILRSGVYLLVPYLLTAVLGLAAVRRLPGKEGMYVCGSISTLMCVICPLSEQFAPVLYEAQNFVIWVLAAVVLMVCLGKEYRKNINHLEEFIWNW